MIASCTPIAYIPGPPDFGSDAEWDSPDQVRGDSSFTHGTFTIKFTISERAVASRYKGMPKKDILLRHHTIMLGTAKRQARVLCYPSVCLLK